MCVLFAYINEKRNFVKTMERLSYKRRKVCLNACYAIIPKAVKGNEG